MDDGLLAVDLGTSGVKAGVIGVDGRMAAFADRPYALIEGDGPGWFEQDANAWWSAARDAMRDAVATARRTRVVGACVGGQGPSLVAVDERGEPLANAIIWMDRRTEPERRAMAERIGADVSLYSNLPRAMWLRVHRPEVYARARWFLQSWDYIAFRLTGVAVASSFAGNPVFPPALVDATGCDRAKFPREHVMGDAVGTIRPDVARDLGVAPGVVVAGGVNDSTATVLGAGLVRRGLALDLGGTSGGIALAWDRPLGEHGLTAWPAPTPGLYVCGGPLASAGRALPWVMSATGYAPHEYAAIERDASTAPPGSDGLVFLPYLAGERTPIWDDRARGVFFGLTERHTRAHLARAVLEGVAFSLRHIADTLSEAGGTIEELRVTGGQAKVALWCRIKADVLGVPVSVPAVTEGAVLGEAVLAAAAARRAPDVATAASRFMIEAARLEPDPASAPAYAAAYRTYRALYPRLAELMRGA
ncbi:MAG TPA: FGGY-family carbohydrate kinase [Candidatus Limnocylindria bacterium]|nr:FGGY-family carbohydrate kinase [Candidatus Limnocylindria bacterium]